MCCAIRIDDLPYKGHSERRTSCSREVGYVESHSQFGAREGEFRQFMCWRLTEDLWWFRSRVTDLTSIRAEKDIYNPGGVLILVCGGIIASKATIS